MKISLYARVTLLLPYIYHFFGFRRLMKDEPKRVQIEAMGHFILLLFQA